MINIESGLNSHVHWQRIKELRIATEYLLELSQLK